MTNKWKLIILLLFTFLTLTGCMQIDMHVTVNKDGSGEYEWKFLTSPYLQSYVQQLEGNYRTKNYEVKTIQENGNVGFIATKYVKSLAQQPLGNEFSDSLNTTSLVLNQMAANEDMVYPTAGNPTGNFRDHLQINPTFFSTTFLFHTNADLSKLGTANSNSSYSSYARSLLDQLKMRFILTLPINPSEHNANEVIDAGKTLIWNLQSGSTNPIRVGVKLPTPLVLVVAAANGQAQLIPNFAVLALSWLLVIIILIILLIVLIRKLFGRKKPPSGGNKYPADKPLLDDSFKWDN